MATPDDARHWHYFGSAFLVLGAALLGIRATLVAVATPHPAFFNWYAYVGIGFFVLAFACGGAAALEVPFPTVAIAWVVRVLPSGALTKARATLSSLAEWSPIVWRGTKSRRPTPKKSTGQRSRAASTPARKSATRTTTKKVADARQPAAKQRGTTPRLDGLTIGSTSGVPLTFGHDLGSFIERGKKLADRSSTAISFSGADTAFQWRADVENALAHDPEALRNFRSAEQRTFWSSSSSFFFGDDSNAIRRQVNALEKIMRDRRGW